MIDLHAFVRVAFDRNGPRGTVALPDESEAVARQIVAIVEQRWADEKGDVWHDGSLLILKPDDYRKIRPLGVIRRFTTPREFRGVPYRHAVMLCGRLAGRREFVPLDERPRGRPPKILKYVPAEIPVAPFVAPRKGCGCGSRSPEA